MLAAHGLYLIAGAAVLLAACGPTDGDPTPHQKRADHYESRPANLAASQHRPSAPALTKPFTPHPECGVQAPAEYAALIRTAARKHFPVGRDRDGECWSIATATAESHWKLRAVSPVGAACFFQLMPDTARHVGVTDVFDAGQCIDGGVRYLAWCVAQWLKRTDPYQRSFLQAAKIGSFCFNAGPAGPVRSQRKNGCDEWDDCFEQHAPEETRTYVPRVALLARTGEWYRSHHP